MEIRTYTNATTERSTYYSAIYITLLGIISFTAAMLFNWITTECIPFRALVWAGENLTVLFGLTVFAILAIILYPKVDRSSTLNVTRVFTNSVYNKQNGLCYGMGWNIGNLLEKFQGKFKSFIEKDSTEENKPLKVKSLNDEPRVWGTLVIRAMDARVLNYGVNESEILATIKPMLWDRVKSLIEGFTAPKPNDQILGHGGDVTTEVNSQLMNVRWLRESGFTVSWITGNMDESEEAAAARKGLIIAKSLAEGVKLVQTPEDQLYDNDGKLKEGAFCREEATASLLVAQGKAGAEFKRNRDERLHIIRVEAKDPEALKIAAQSGAMLGIAAAHPITHTTTI